MRLKVSNVCQLLDKSKYPATKTLNGVTFTNNGDGIVTVSGTSTEIPAAYILTGRTGIVGHKYLVYGCPTGGAYSKYRLTASIIKNGVYSDGFSDSGDGNISKVLEEGEWIDIIIDVVNISDANLVFKPQLFDLTEMYGIGNEPTTVEQFRQDFPNEMYEYSPVCWKKFSRLKYIANKEPVQLLDKSKYPDTTTHNGIIWTNNGDGTITTTGNVNNKGTWLNISNSTVRLISNRKYLLCGCPSGGSTNTYWLKLAPLIVGDPVDVGGGIIFTAQETSINHPLLQINPNLGNNLLWKPQLYDLTEMYGAGNEPTTVAQFRVDFPNELYDYNPYNYLTLNRGKFIANKEPVQLLDKSDFKTAVSKGVTATPNTTNGMWTISGAATASEYLPIGRYRLGTNFDIGDKLFLRNSNIDNSVYFPYAGWYDKDNKYLGEYDGMGVFSVTNPETAYIACYFATRTVADINVTTQVQLFNLTRMYGVGNEPTAAEFVAQYSEFDYPVNKYNAITFR